MKYRKDIDGLRALAVLPVVAFHSGISFFSGGFVGVDVFFVISGYLITTLLINEIEKEKFSLLKFYKRRAARILPSLFVTLTIVITFAFFFYNLKAFDRLGKEVFFSSLGVVNILFAEGADYFAKDKAFQPLIHLWSLSVEEQFYALFSLLLLFINRRLSNHKIAIISILVIALLGYSIYAVELKLNGAYFLLQYRAFELLLGSLTAVILYHNSSNFLESKYREILTYIGFLLLFTPMLILTKESSFPGINALIPCIGTILLIAFPNQGIISKILTTKAAVSIGLISYPLYLFHQPLISFIHFFGLSLSSIQIFFIVLFFSSILAFFTYKHIETPLRKLASSGSTTHSNVAFFIQALCIPIFALIGFGIAKSGGLEDRFNYLNPFAVVVSEKHKLTFHEEFERGFNVSESNSNRVLFVGDSVLQHYMVPLKNALGMKNSEIDSVTRGGCVLLKGVEFKDKFADISCNELRSDLYNITKPYDIIVISQSWKSYNGSVLNFAPNSHEFDRWRPFLEETISHFEQQASLIIILGAHPSVVGNEANQPSLLITPESYIKNLNNIKITNYEELTQSQHFFSTLNSTSTLLIIEPLTIFCKKECSAHSEKWSYFNDSQHLSSAATNFISTELKQRLNHINSVSKLPISHK